MCETFVPPKARFEESEHTPGTRTRITPAFRDVQTHKAARYLYPVAYVERRLLSLAHDARLRGVRERCETGGFGVIHAHVDLVSAKGDRLGLEPACAFGFTDSHRRPHRSMSFRACSVVAKK